MRVTRAILAVGVIAALAGCSDKQKVDVEKIKQEITAELAEMAGVDKNRYFAHDGVEVTPDVDGFDVKVANVRLLPDQPQSMILGAVDFHLVPKGEDQYDISELKLPSSVAFTEPSGGQGKLEIGDQQFKGLWSKSLNAFLNMDGTYKAIKISDPSGGEATIEEVTASGVSTDKGNGLWDQTAKAVAKNLRIKGTDGTMIMAGIDVTSESHGVKLAELQKLREKFNQLASDATSGKPTDPAILQELRNYGNWLVDSKGSMDLSGLSFTDPAGAPVFTLEHFIVEGAATGMDQPTCDASFGFQTLGLKVPAAETIPMMASFGQFIPSRFNMGLAFDDVPPATIWGAMVDMFGTLDFTQQNPGQADVAAQVFGFQLLQVLQSAGSTFRMTGWEIETPATQLKLDGAVKPDAGSPFGAVANINTEITGFDAIIAVLGEAGAADVLPMIALVRGFSNQEAAADGKMIDRYAIELLQTGEVTINGKPFDIMGAMMGTP